MLWRFWLVKIPFWKYAPSNEGKHGSSNSSDNFLSWNIEEFWPVCYIGIFQRTWRYIQYFSLSNVHCFLLLIYKLIERSIGVWIFYMIIPFFTREIILNITSSDLINIINWSFSLLRKWFDNLFIIIRNIIVHFSLLLISNKVHFFVIGVGLL